ncbi:MAG TPA: amino acid ABC transporter permease [Candidatus Ornithoclostridium excrementipullorum]|nr:amino acid ABC transporter permease [Candidatus Ornithoclostridium excrementipullorum]
MFLEVFNQFAVGFGYTVGLFAVTLVAAIPLGIIVSLCSISRFRPIKWLTKVFIWVVRGTPLLLQIIVITFIPSTVFALANKDLASFFGVSVAGLNFIFAAVAFIINYSAYFAEIFRGGIEAIPRGQYEAAQVLGMKRGQTFFRVILPQVCKRILAPISNEVITLVKDTSLARVIGVTELFMVAYNVVTTEAIIWPLFFAGLYYLLFNGLLTILFHAAEKKLSYYKV